MGLERRGDRYYFYKKKRIGKRVVSIYEGSGEMGSLMCLLDQQSKEEAWLEREAKRRSFEAEKAEQNEIDQRIDAFCEDAKAVEDAIFLINGYHVHSRQWRRKQSDNEESNG